MSKQNVEIVKRLFEAVERRDREGVFSAYHPEITIREAETLPYGGEFHGFEGAMKHALCYRAVWDALQSKTEQQLSPTFLDAGDYVVVLWRQRAAKGDKKFDSPAASIYRLRDGKIIESEMFQGTAAIRDFLNGDK